MLILSPHYVNVGGKQHNGGKQSLSAGIAIYSTLYSVRCFGLKNMVELCWKLLTCDN